MDNTFQINSHLDVLKRLDLAKFEGEHRSSDEIERIVNLMPKVYEPYVKRNKTFDRKEKINLNWEKIKFNSDILFF